MKQIYFLTAIFVLTVAGLIQAQNAGSNLGLQDVERLSDIYHIDKDAVSRNYAKLFDSDFLTSLKALDFFTENKAYEFIAMALPKLPEGLKGPATQALLQKRDFSPIAFKALLSELNSAVVSEATSGEERSGNEAMRKQISALLAQWLLLPEPQVTSVTRSKEQPEYMAFIAKAQVEGAKIKTSSPY